MEAAEPHSCMSGAGVPARDALAARHRLLTVPKLIVISPGWTKW